MSKAKLFIESFLIYGLGGVISKLIPLIMLPIITRLMPDTFYFGLNDLSVTVVSFGTALAIMGMCDAMFRMFFEKEDEEYRKDICSSALGFTLLTSFAVFIILIIFRSFVSKLIFSDVKYQNLLLLTAMSILIGSTNSIVAAPTRMNNQRKVFLITNTLSSVLSYAVSIPLLIRGYYVVALPLSSVISALAIEVIFGILNKNWFQLKRVNWQYIKEMLVIGLPLLPNFLIYWLLNASNRLMIAKMMGNEYTGIYAVGAKLGQVSQLIYTAFAGGWQYFAFSTMKDEDQVQTTSNIYEYLGVISFIAGMFVAALSKPIFHLLFTGEYVKGYIVAPYLFLAPLFQMLFQVASNQYLVIKKTWPNMLILSVGAVVNIIINFTLIPTIGIEGAAIASLLGYVVSNIVCILALKRIKLIRLSAKFMITTGLLIVFFIMWRLVIGENVLISLIIASLITLIYFYLYKKDLLRLIKVLKKGNN
ncbi:MATE efflux family protein [Clostridium sp. N3C]|uniref:lipopolysaccharide biosynthesis protein n=1 Tax=Clostridium sp. N3C TaxID=1776758 RepID=UPI00092DF823|nr:oligosaccharide flippase family protein [Clostridium sp. N3C]SCN23720.1 MATE efflux family protein [Clostridium sp. N3C]